MKRTALVSASIILAAAIILFGAVYVSAAQGPHGSYDENTNDCANCHITHNGQGAGLIMQPSVNSLCYLCHDAGGQSRYDVAGEFGTAEPYAASNHGVPQGTLKCTDCHNPHDGGKDADGVDIHWPKLLQSSADESIHEGNDFCFSCHKTSQNGLMPIDPTKYPVSGTGHNNAAFTVNGIQPFNPDSGTGISCSGCHEKHGSALTGLLKKNPNGDSLEANGNNKSFCYECHGAASPDDRYKGQGAFEGSKHSLVTSLNTNTDYPGVIGQAGQCSSCHDSHGTANGTSKVAMKTLRGAFNDGKTNYTASDFDLCFQCHNGSSINPDYDVQGQYTASGGGHRIKTEGGNLAVGSVLSCETCHNLHGSSNNNKYSLNDSLGSNLGDGRNECLACHQDGKTVEGIAMSPPPSSVPDHGSNSTAACLECHGGPHNISSGASEGGQDCSICHSSLVLATSSSDSGYHHLLSDSSATYSTTQNGSRNCLSCHVDHNKFNNQKAYNLKANYTESFARQDTTPGKNTDFNPADPGYGGLCLSCHKDRQAKENPQADNTIATPPVSITGYTGSAHNYTAASEFSDATQFNANCSKCHNDNMTKTGQTSTNRFGTHNSDYRSILSPFGDTTLTDPLKQQFCLKCHDTGGDVYGTTMSAESKDIANQFSGESKHDITGVTGAQLTCVNCHGPHIVSRNPFAAGLGDSDISNPDNTLESFITAAGDISRFCITCHDGSPPQAINDGTAFVPYNVTFPDWEFTNNTGGWDKSSYTGEISPAGHYSQGYQCDKCHDKHGSSNPMLTTLPEDPAAVPASGSGICLQCHGDQTGRPEGAANVYTDFTKGSDFTYRHPALDYTGRHDNRETFPWDTADRHAECYDCHDPHSASAGNVKVTGPAGNTAPAASGKLGNVTGVTVTDWPAAWSPVPAAGYTLGTVVNEYELCFKCHSGFNGNFPSPPAGAVTQTDIAMEFNPNNASYHYLGIPGSNSRTIEGTYAGPFDAGTKLYCTSCHGSDGTPVTSPGAIHGSANRYILKAPFSENTGTAGTGNDLCYRCHDVNTYGAAGTSPNQAAGASGFSNSGQGNLHVSVSEHRVACVKCHTAVPHGYKNKKLLVTASDPAPYNNGSQLIVNNWAASGNWRESDCSGCH
ncbi:MAG: hypothetical protein CVU89_11615 [Firmicutes bacterium HGW-Firmicutes-14]|nr:MAG: hypothetical protein CVU89_11615 [Firmicutes bacterium HGW-Firmicutes-14]